MISRDRIVSSINHQEPDRVPIDLGASRVSGMHVSTVYKLRRYLGLDQTDRPVKVVEPVQMLGEIEPDLLDAIGADATGLFSPISSFGFLMDNWKPWNLHDGTPVLVPEAFNTDIEPGGDIFMYPRGDKSASPSARMPAGGFYFDAIIRQNEIEEENLDPKDNVEEYQTVGKRTLEHYAKESDRLKLQDRAVLANFGGTGFGDIATIPGISLREPKGIRDIEEWYVSLYTRPEYVRAMFENQCEIALGNLEKIRSLVGDTVQVVYTSGTDFGAQNGPFISPASYRELFKPFNKIINDWVHNNTNWKTFVHSCGSIVELMDDMVEAGFDIFNPVQCSAAGMDPLILKKRYGKQISFWGGGVDTQKTLPFGTVQDVKDEVRKRLDVFMPGGGFVFNQVHNVQANVPVENLVAMWETVREHGKY